MNSNKQSVQAAASLLLAAFVALLNGCGGEIVEQWLAEQSDASEVVAEAEQDPLFRIIEDEEGRKVYQLTREIVISGRIQRPNVFYALQRTPLPLPELPYDEMAAFRLTGQIQDLVRQQQEELRRLETGAPLSQQQRAAITARYEARIQQLERLEEQAHGALEKQLRLDLVSKEMTAAQRFMRLYALAQATAFLAITEYLHAMDEYGRQLRQFHEGTTSEAPSIPRLDYGRAIKMYRELIREFPDHRMVDGAIYSLGFYLAEMAELEQGNQAFLALVCANRYGSIDQQPSGPENPGPAMDLTVYDGCTPLVPLGQFNAEAWTRIGEYHFDEDQLGRAIAAYGRVLDIWPLDNRFIDVALYKLAWSHYRADDYQAAIEYFDRLVTRAENQTAGTETPVTEMLAEAIQRLAICFAEEDWDGDAVPDGKSGLQRIEEFYAGRWRESHVLKVYYSLGQIIHEAARYAEAAEFFDTILYRWGYRR